MSFEMVSGPAHSADDRPPSVASDWMMRPCATSASSRSARYKLDFPLPLAPVTTVSCPSSSRTSRRDRYPAMARREIMPAGGYPPRKMLRPANLADGPNSCSIRISWLYFAVRSLRARLPVLIWPQLVATARSAMVASSVSPLR